MLALETSIAALSKKTKIAFHTSLYIMLVGRQQQYVLCLLKSSIFRSSCVNHVISKEQTPRKWSNEFPSLLAACIGQQRRHWGE